MTQPMSLGQKLDLIISLQGTAPPLRALHLEFHLTMPHTPLRCDSLQQRQTWNEVWIGNIRGQ